MLIEPGHDLIGEVVAVVAAEDGLGHGLLNRAVAFGREGFAIDLQNQVVPVLLGELLERIKAIHDVLGMGRLEVSLGTVNPLPHDAMLSSLKLIGEEIVPVLHQEVLS